MGESMIKAEAAAERRTSATALSALANHRPRDARPRHAAWAL